MFLFLDAFTYLKDVFGGLLRLAPDALHVHVGIAIFFAVALVVRGPRAFVTAFWAVLAVAVVAEVFDLLYDLQVGRRLRWLNSLKDIVNAIIWPAAWMLFGPRIVQLVRPDAPARATPSRETPAREMPLAAPVRSPAPRGWNGGQSARAVPRFNPAGEPVGEVAAVSGVVGLEPAAMDRQATARLHGLENAGK